ncbi:RnfABCDGE type electron transport complex subunit D [Psychromarinibacter sp. S121]|uniref:RnfABCDGE type electron transport complex subunit D n=1 Tax=Psychromarinibacter sp. S121 TaxID=3415127 RepID=UPI003C7D7311
MIRGLWDRETIALTLLAAMLPMGASWLIAGGLEAAGRLLFFLVVAGIWHVLWMLARAQPPSFAGALTALAIAMLAPEDLGLFALLLGTSFGVVMAELAFGGWGRNVLNPATIALAFLGFSYPAAPWPELPVQLGWAAWPAAAIGVVFGVTSLRLLAGAALGFAAAMLAGLDLTAVWTGALVALMLLVCDPVASAATGLGRWLNGLLYALLIALFAVFWDTAAPVQAAVSAALLTSLAAPLLDEFAIALWLARRKRLG